ncbi:MAG: VWA domain-containing protein [Muribaculaceae bacterium]|nr:VWA domain-containing protein [Muribaculaceae bacterium]
MTEQENSFISLETCCTEGYRRFLLDEFREAFGADSQSEGAPAFLRENPEYQPEYDLDEDSDEGDFFHPVDPDGDEAQGEERGFRNSAYNGMPRLRKGGGNVMSDYTITLRELWNIKPLKQLMRCNENIFNEVEQQFMDFVRDTEQELEEAANPFQREMDLLERLRESIGDYAFDMPELQVLTERFLSERDRDFFAAAEDSMATRCELVSKLEEGLAKALSKWRGEEIRRKSREWAAQLKSKAEKVQKVQAMAGGTGLTSALLWGMGSGEWSLFDAQFFALYEQVLANSKAIRDIVNMLGRMACEEQQVIEELYSRQRLTPTVRIGRAQKSEVVGVTLSDDLSNLLPSEVAFLSTSAAENLFYKKFVEKKLQTFDYINREKVMRETTETAVRKKLVDDDGKGPIILCVDTSGSMMGEPEIIAKALALAMMQQALKENRKCYLIAFSVDIQAIELTSMQSWSDLVEFLRGGFHAGTDLDPAFEEALRMLDSNDYRRADILAISDFIMPPLPAETMAQVACAKANKTRFHALIVNNDFSDTGLGDTFSASDLGQVFDNLWYYDCRGGADLGTGEVRPLVLGDCLRTLKQKE